MKTLPLSAWVGIVVLALVLQFVPTSMAMERPLPRATPESQGISSAELSDFVHLLDQQIEGMHSLMIVRHGKVIVEGWWNPYRAQDNHILYSLSKSFTSTAVGMAVTEGKLSIDDEVTKYFPDLIPKEASANLKAMRVRDLLTMSTGHQDEPSAAPDVLSVKSFLAQPVPHIPGTHFKYNTAATFMQSALVQKVTGQTVLDYLRSRLFVPLGIEQPVWDTNFEGVSLGGYGLRVRTEDIAKFGQLYLQKGKWQGKQLIPEAWVGMATSKQVSNGSNPKNDWNQGYGFQFWRCRNNAYRGDGAFGQYCVVLPDQDVVVAITSGVKDMQAVLNLCWEKFLPMCHPNSLARNRRDLDKLVSQMGTLGVTMASGKEASDLSARVLNRKYVFPANDQKLESLTVTRAEAGRALMLTVNQGGEVYAFPAGFGQWARGRSTFAGGRLAQFKNEPVAGTFGWETEDTLAVKVCATETPFHALFRLRFVGDQVQLGGGANVGFGATQKPELTGKAQ
jgi:CubicO group peptidase (beta-lactamase class C family)